MKKKTISRSKVVKWLDCTTKDTFSEVETTMDIFDLVLSSTNGSKSGSKMVSTIDYRKPEYWDFVQKIVHNNRYPPR